MNLAEFRQLLDDGSSDTAPVLHHIRLHGVRARVIARRRRRVAALAAAAVLAAGGAATAVVLPDAPVTPPAGPPPGVRMIEGFPEYADGAHVTAAKSTVLADGRIELTVVPETTDLVVFTRCYSTDPDSNLERSLSVNGIQFSSGSCASGGSLRRGWDDLGVSVGEPAIFVLELSGGPAAGETGTFGLAIGERIPFADYPLPPRPTDLGPLPETLPFGCTESTCPDATIIRSDPADPTRPMLRTIAWRTLSSIDMVALTPGFLHVRVDGVEVARGEWWDYQQGGYGTGGDADGGWRSYGVDPDPGDTVTIEIVPEHVTGQWQVVLTPALPGE